MDKVQQLRECLKKHIHVQQAVLQLAQQKKQILIYGPMQDLEPLVNQEVQLIRQMKTLEEKRISLLDNQHQSMLEWIQALHPEHQEELLQLRYQLRSVIMEVKQANELNQQLIDQSMKYVQYSIDVLTEDEVELTYSPVQKNFMQGRQRSLFDGKA